MAGVNIKPVEGYVAVQSLDADDEESSTDAGRYTGSVNPAPTTNDDWRESAYAIVVEVGAKAPAGVRAGVTVLVRKSELQAAIKVSDDVLLLPSWAIVAIAGK